MKPEILTLLKTIDSYAQKNHDKCWCVPFDEGQFLHLLVSIAKPKFILEIGTSIGFSTIWLATAATEYGGKVKTIEIHAERAKIAQEHFTQAKLSNITLLQGDAAALLKDMKAPFDFVFLDGGKEHYLEQLQILEKNGCIKKGTLVVADNAVVKEHKKNDKLLAYLEYVRHSGKYRSSYVPFENGVEVSYYQ